MKDRFEIAIERLQAGQSISVWCNMGSCQCADIGGTISVRDGRLWFTSSESSGGGHYDEPAATTDVRYIGATVRQIAALFGETVKFPEKAAHYSNQWQICLPTGS